MFGHGKLSSEPPWWSKIKECFWLKNKILVKILNLKKIIIFRIFGKFCTDKVHGGRRQRLWNIF
jgi:hypothetical protein